MKKTEEEIRLNWNYYLSHTMWFCKPCNLYISLGGRATHKRTIKHKANSGLEPISNKWFCDICNKEYHYHWKPRHKQTTKHLRLLESG